MALRRPVRPMIISLAALVGASLGLVAPSVPAEATPSLRYETVVSGLSHPWDVSFAGDLMLFDERGGTVWSKRGSAAAKKMTITGFPKIFAEGESGLLGLVVDPGVATNKRFYTCQATRTSAGAKQDTRVLRWRLTDDTHAVSDGSPVVTGLPLNTGRHGGCRLRFGTDGKLYVGTGDAAIGTNPQDLQSLGGKVLRVGWDGKIPTDNPFYSKGGNARYVWTYGHRNVQGLALRPGSDQMWSVEQGSSRDDEVNLLSKGANYGWNPVPGYNESVPMTDTTKYPSAKKALWSSGSSTIATSGGTFLQGARWGEYQGWMVVGVLKGQQIRVMRVDLAGKISASFVLSGSTAWGRIREPQLGPDGNLYVTTDNGTNDKIIRIVPTTPGTPSVAVGSVILPSGGVSATRTGSQVYVFVRSVNDRVFYKRSTDDARTWSGWVYAGVTSSDAPSVASSASGRVDLVTRDPAKGVVHTWFVNGTKTGQTSLGGSVSAQNLSSPGDKTIDVFAVGAGGVATRRHYNGSSWSSWTSLGGVLTSGLSASVNNSTKVTTVTGRGRSGGTHQLTVTASSNGSGWVGQSDHTSAYSARALGDTWSGVGMVAVSSGADRNLVVQRDGVSKGSLIMGVQTYYNANPDVVTRPDGTFIVFGRSSSGGVWLHDARSGGYANVSLGGDVR